MMINGIEDLGKVKSREGKYNKNRYVNARCHCGEVFEVRWVRVVKGITKSCGCSFHNMSSTPLYQAWSNMKQRCNYKKATGYKNYGGRGITVCKAWNDFLVYREWAIGAGWEEGWQVDRIDNDKGYYPENCRIATHLENQQNRGSLKGSSSRYKGVNLYKKDGTWQAGIAGKYLGRYATQEEAAEVYNIAAKELFGEFAYINKIKDTQHA